MLLKKYGVAEKGRWLLLLLLFFATVLCGCGKKEQEQKVTNLNDLQTAKYRIGVMTGIAAAREAQNRFPNAEFMEYPMPIDAFTAVTSGKIDAVVLDRPTLEFMALAHPGLSVMKEDLAVGHISVAAAKRSKKLMNQVDEFIRRYRADGTYQQMYDRWFRMKDSSMPEIPLPEHPDGVLKVGVTANNEPMCFIQDGDLAGFDSEFAIRLAAFLNQTVEFKDIPYDALVPALESGKIDLAVAQMDAMPEREESVLFSTEYIDSPITVLISKQLYDPGRINDVNTKERQETVMEPACRGGISQIVRIDETNDVKITGSSGFTESCLNFCLSFWGSFYKTFIRGNRWLLILQGLGTTILITVCSVLFGTLLAFPVCMMCRSRRKLLSWIGDRYVSFIMGTPLLVILMLLYYVVFAKADISGIVVAILAFGMDFAAYTSVTLRTGIDSIPRGQTEAALALGHTPMGAFFRIVLPQAVRSILPVYRGEVISTLKATSIVGYIAIMDLTKMGDIIRSRTYEAFFPLISIAVIYYLVAKLFTAILLIGEDKLNPERRRDALKRKRGAK